MDKLLDVVSATACLISPEKIQALASRILRTKVDRVDVDLSDVVATPAASGVVDQLIQAWRTTAISAEELASMLLTASHVLNKRDSEQSTELVWTGPVTPFVAARRTEQVLLQVINAAKKTLFITSFVAYDVSTIVNALNDAVEREVDISMLLESSQDHGGRITVDAIGKMRILVPSARLYAWYDRTGPFSDGSVHAKVVVADGNTCFITSANLTGFAMEKNMEAGVLISGGRIPRLLDEHLRSLIDTKVISGV